MIISLKFDSSSILNLWNKIDLWFLNPHWLVQIWPHNSHSIALNHERAQSSSSSFKSFALSPFVPRSSAIWQRNPSASPDPCHRPSKSVPRIESDSNPAQSEPQTVSSFPVFVLGSSSWPPWRCQWETGGSWIAYSLPEFHTRFVQLACSSTYICNCT